MTRTLQEGVCVDADDIAAFLLARLEPASVRALETHVAACSDCRELLSALAQSESLSTSAIGPQDADSISPTMPLALAPDMDLAIGACIGRYVVLERLGAGGMGVVYAAHDPELNRNVALKILRGDAFGPAEQELLRDRLRREAQAMAQLAHPHVVTVHDVGSVGDRIFIAMELVEGQTFGAWLLAAPRTWREVVAKLLPAGEGLAAAHAAGLVHRDFKPENVLVGNDGRVRVGDFGLARALAGGDASEATDGPPAPALPAALDLGARTMTGSLVGTPFYMAPEQFLGHPTDARTDQFSFCVALHAAIVGEHPFEGEGVDGLARAVTQGKLRSPPRPDPLPRWLRRVLQRGLAVRPADRYPSMSELLAALGRDPRRRLLYGAAIAVPLLALVLSGVLASRSSANGAQLVCKFGDKKWTGIWDARRSAAIEKAFLATGKPYAAASFASVAHSFDAYARRWALAHTEACEATRVRGEQSEEMLDKRMLCLDARLRDARALSDRFVAAAPEDVEQAPRVVETLGELSSCADVQALSSQVPPPADPVTRTRVAALRGRLAVLKAGNAVDRRATRSAEARALVGEARATRYRPLEAEALFEESTVDSDSGDAKAAGEKIEQSIWAAEASRFDELAARAWTKLMIIQGDLGHYEEALALAPRVTALLERLGGNDELEGALLLARAQLYGYLDRYAEAAADADRAHTLLERRFGPDDLRVAEALDELGEVAFYAERPKDARGYYQRELVIKQKVYGSLHPEVAKVLASIGQAYWMENRYDDAIVSYQAAGDIFARTLPPVHPQLAKFAHNFALVYEAKSDWAKAVELHRQAVEIGAATFGKDHPNYASFLMGLGYTLVPLGRHDEALATLHEALRLLEKQLGPEHGKVATCLEHIGQLLLEMHRPEEARAILARTIPIYEKVYGARTGNVRQALLGLGLADLDLDAPERALPELERAYALGPEADPGTIAEIEYALARALVESHKDRARGMTLLRKARAEFAKDDREAENLAALDAWLKKHR